jgi:hypothetical protein
MTKLLRYKGAPPAVPFIKEIRNRLGKDTGRFGLFEFGNYEFGSINAIGRDLDGVYQMRRCSEGKIPVKMRFQETREETATPARVANWSKFASAVASWQALTDEQKAVYNERAKGTSKTGNNIFISEYMLS